MSAILSAIFAGALTCAGIFFLSKVIGVRAIFAGALTCAGIFFLSVGIFFLSKVI